MSETKMITYQQAINQAQIQAMEKNRTVFVYGLDVADHKRTYGTGANLVEKFGTERCFSTPLSEEAMMGMGIGAALNGMRPINVHIRVDFLLLAMNQLINIASTACYGSEGKLSVPLVVRAVIGRGWGQGFQHSKSLQSIFAHIPGLIVVMPTTPYDVKGLLINSIRNNNPVIFLEHRWLYWQEGEVPKKPFTIPFGKGKVLINGKDITIVATSWMNVEAQKAAEVMSRRNISVEIIDPRSITPLDEKLIINSVKKTGRCIIADNDWLYCGFSAEVATRIYEKCYKKLKSPLVRIGFAPTPCPTVRKLENHFYPNAENIIREIERMLGLEKADLSNETFYSHEVRFKGPF